MSRQSWTISIICSLLLFIGGTWLLNRKAVQKQSQALPAPTHAPTADALWTAPPPSGIPLSEEGELIRYGQSLIIQTAIYFGPGGILHRQTNGMNCQNCHLKAGTQPWGNNFGGVFSTYPKFRERRGAVENIPQRITDCFERSLNGKAPDSNSREMKAMLAYIQWLGRGVPRGLKPKGSGIEVLPYLDRAADPTKGQIIYTVKCQRCHGANGEGHLSVNRTYYVYPPLWGLHSYNTGAGLFRLSRLAGFIKNNMPLGVDYQKKELTDEEAWDLAAYINSRPRPKKYFNDDWPDISLKPVDHPFGPYTDSYPERQHKFGPWVPIQQRQKEIALKKKKVLP